MSKEAKFIKEFDFLGLSRCFSVRIEKSSKMSKIEPNCVILGCFFEVYSILTEKQHLKPRKSNSLMNFASLDTQLDPPVARLWRYIQFYTLFWNLTTAAPPIISYGTSKVMPKISVHDLMTISRVLLLLIGQNDINPKLLQSIVASIRKIMTAKKPCVYQGPC